MGHYFLYKRNLPQTEEDADMFIEEFFKNYLPPFFSWIYQIELRIRDKNNKERMNDGENYSSYRCYKFYKDYLKFSKNGH
jgi:hypothetical protein